MKLIIDIDEEIYKSSKEECDENDSLIIDNFTLAIGNGTLLSEELGKIKSEIEKLNNIDYGSMFNYEAHRGARDMQDDIIYVIENYIRRINNEGNH